MNITINSKSLGKALKIASKVISGKTILPILDCFLIEAENNRLTITASNNEVSVIVPVPILNSVEDGSCCIYAKALIELINLLPDEDILLETKGDSMHIIWEKGEKNTPIHPASDYPNIGKPEKKLVASIPGQELLIALERTIPFAQISARNPIMEGIHLDMCDKTMRVVSSDTHILRYYEIESTFPEAKITIHSAVAQLLKSIIEKNTPTVMMIVGEKDIMFNLGNAIVISRTIAGKYPNYMRIIPQEENIVGELEVDRYEMTIALKRLASTDKKVSMDINPLAITMVAESPNKGEKLKEDIDCTYSGENMHINMNIDKLLTIVESLSSNKLIFKFQGSTKAALVREAECGSATLSLIMPLA